MPLFYEIYIQSAASTYSNIAQKSGILPNVPCLITYYAFLYPFFPKFCLFRSSPDSTYPITIFYTYRQQLPFSPYAGDGRVALIGQILRAYPRPPHSKSKPSH
ncbi:hypothetical protein ACN38_g6288 [Penicillium nordicum]|uniref:Uncharacterized protein n=1 Tax=Penicillium nordicum TaxID=229535 RepID=A0A0M9WFF7_9EURO|nr:hypothetical protein ACN38_g6288 [Penicillium nordicum]